nr:MFS transporter [Kibdelosporangium sp. MJ126-NF4]
MVEATAQRLWTTRFVLLCLATLGYFVAVGTQIPTLPRYLSGTLHATELQVGLSALAFSVASLVARIPVMRGARSRTVMIGGCLILASASALLTVPSLTTVYVSRVLVGVSDAMFFTLAANYVYDVTPPKRHGTAMSYLTVSLFVGLLIGPVLGETVRVAFGFTSVWLVAAGLALMAAGVTAAVRLPRRTLPGPGARLVDLPARLWLPAVLVVAGTLGANGYALYVPMYSAGIGQRETTLNFAVLAGTTLVLRFAAASWLDRFPAERVVACSLAVSAAGLLTIGLVAYPAGLLAGTVLLGAGQAFLFPALLTLVARDADEQARAAAIAVLTACHDLTFGLAGMVLGGVVQYAGFAIAFCAAATVSAAGALLLAVERKPQ